MIVITSGFRDFKRSADYKHKFDIKIETNLHEVCSGAIANVSIIVHTYDMSYCSLDLLSTKDG
jgi:hypothetical protein